MARNRKQKLPYKKHNAAENKLKVVEPETAQSKKNSSSKRLFFNVLMYALPFLFFVILEVGLRMFGYGATYPLFVPFEDDPAYSYLNQEVARRYFKSTNSLPNGNIDFFETIKSDNVFRIVVQGGSSAAGFPYYRGGSFSRMLKAQMQATYPNQKFEVINTAMAAVNSYTLLDFVDEIKAIKPDLVLIYAGHNEYYGALGVGSSQSSGFLTRIYFKLRHIKTVELINQLIAGIRGWFSSPSEKLSGTLMSQMVGEQQIPFNSNLFRAGEEQFKANLSEILTAYQDAGIPVMIGTLASNESDHKPFISSFLAETDKSKWEALYQESLASLTKGDSIEAYEKFSALVKLDTTVAWAYYGLAKAMEAVESYSKKEILDTYIKAKDLDNLRFRAPESFNRDIQDIATSKGATIVDIQAAMRQESPKGIIGNSLMLEHLHPNMDGYLIMAHAFYQAIMSKNLIRGDISSEVTLSKARELVNYSPADSVLASLRVQTLMASWPFKPQGTLVQSVPPPEMKSEAEKVGWKLYQPGAIWYLETKSLVNKFLESGAIKRAENANQAFLEEYYILPEPWVNKAIFDALRGEHENAQNSLEIASKLKLANKVYTYYANVGNALVSMNRPNEAIAYFESSLSIEKTPYALKMLGGLFLNKSQKSGNLSELQRSIVFLEEAIQLAPNDVQALYNLAGAYAVNKEFQKVKPLLSKVLQLQPNHAGARNLLNQIAN